MIEHTGDLLTSGAKHIGHGANTVGVMGAGIAKVIRAKYPEVYDDYRKFCLDNLSQAGGNHPVRADDGTVVHNIFSQDMPGANATYEWLYQGLVTACLTLRIFNSVMGRAYATNYTHELHIPRIGCGIGGLDWPSVKSVIRMVEEETGVEIHVWSL